MPPFNDKAMLGSPTPDSFCFVMTLSQLTTFLKSCTFH